jgi:hypothetical protein
MISHICCKCLSGCKDVVYVCNGFQVFLGVLQVFHTYVACV